MVLSENLSVLERVHRRLSGASVGELEDSNDNVERKSFKQRKDFTTRQEEVNAIRSKFPTKIPVIVERFSGEKILPNMEKVKFLVPQELTVSQLSTIIKNRLHLSSTQAFYLFVNNKIMATLSTNVAELYRVYSDEDGFLYITYASQEVFG